MTTKAKANMDFSNSAVNLNNNEVVIKDWQYLNDLKCQMRDLVDTIAKHIPPELNDRQAELGMLIAKAENLIRADIEEWGSYQDTKLGHYALKQKKITKLYSANNFESCFPAYALAVLTKSINVPVLEGLIKGGLLSEEGLRRAHVIEDKENYAFIIR